MNQEPIRCIDRDLYSLNMPGSGFEEARGILLGKYAEKELDSKLEDRIREHLQRCDCCTQFLRDFENAETDIFVEAHCPSSAAVDAYLFQRSALSDAETKRIERHLQECELCREESNWLKDLENQKIIDFVPPKKDWVKTLSIVAAVMFAVLSTIFFVQTTSVRSTEDQLRSIAQVKEPDQINYLALRTSSVPLPDEIGRIYDEGVSSLKQGKFQDAARAMERVTDSSPDHSGAIYLLGYSYYQMREMEKAFEYCDRAEQMRPHNLERCLSLVHIALKTGHYGRAIREISALHHEVPDHPQVKALYIQITSITRGKTVRL